MHNALDLPGFLDYAALLEGFSMKLNRSKALFLVTALATAACVSEEEDAPSDGTTGTTGTG